MKPSARILALLFLCTFYALSQESPCEKCSEGGVAKEFKGPSGNKEESDVYCKTFTPTGQSCTTTVCYQKRTCNGNTDIKIVSIKSSCDNYDLTYIYRLTLSEMWRDDDPWDVLPDQSGDTIALRLYSRCCWTWHSTCDSGANEGGNFELERCDSSGCCIQTFRKVFYSSDASYCCHFVAIGVDEVCQPSVYPNCPTCTISWQCATANCQGEPQKKYCLNVCNWIERQHGSDVSSRIVNCGQLKVSK